MKFCKYCEKEMVAETNEEMKIVYRCDCTNFVTEQELRKDLEKLKRKQMQIEQELCNLQKETKLSKIIIEINQKFGMNIIY